MSSTLPLTPESKKNPEKHLLVNFSFHKEFMNSAENIQHKIVLHSKGSLSKYELNYLPYRNKDMVILFIGHLFMFAIDLSYNLFNI